MAARRFRVHATHTACTCSCRGAGRWTASCSFLSKARERDFVGNTVPAEMAQAVPGFERSRILSQAMLDGNRDVCVLRDVSHDQLQEDKQLTNSSPSPSPSASPLSSLPFLPGRNPTGTMINYHQRHNHRPGPSLSLPLPRRPGQPPRQIGSLVPRIATNTTLALSIPRWLLLDLQPNPGLG